MSTTERGMAMLLPAPISLTLEQAMQVAGGLAMSVNQLAPHVIINGIPVESWTLATVLPSVSQTAVGQVAIR